VGKGNIGTPLQAVVEEMQRRKTASGTSEIGLSANELKNDTL